MTALGVFRDDFYNAIGALTQSQVVSTAFTSAATIPAVDLAGAQDCYLLNASGTGGAGITLTTDTAANIIAQIQAAVAAAYKANVSGTGANVSPPPGVPNLFNLTWTFTLVNNTSTAGTILTLAGGTGVTISGTATVAITTSRTWSVSVTSPTTVTFTNAMSGGI